MTLSEMVFDTTHRFAVFTYSSLCGQGSILPTTLACRPEISKSEIILGAVAQLIVNIFLLATLGAFCKYIVVSC
jgi:hypothetical protein